MCESDWYNKMMEWYIPIRRTVYTKTKNWADAEDITQETFYKAIKNKSKYNPNASLKSWLFAIAFNEMKRYKEKYWRGNVSVDLFSNCFLAKNEFEEPTETIDAKQIKYVMKLLPKQQQKVLEMHIAQNIPHRKVMELMGICRTTYWECYNFALKNARNYWEMIKESMEPGEVFRESFKYLTVTEVAGIMKCSNDLVLKMIGQKRLRAVRFNGKKWFIRSNWL